MESSLGSELQVLVPKALPVKSRGPQVNVQQKLANLLRSLSNVVRCELQVHTENNLTTTAAQSSAAALLTHNTLKRKRQRTPNTGIILANSNPSTISAHANHRKL